MRNTPAIPIFNTATDRAMSWYRNMKFTWLDSNSRLTFHDFMRGEGVIVDDKNPWGTVTFKSEEDYLMILLKYS